MLTLVLSSTSLMLVATLASSEKSQRRSPMAIGPVEMPLWHGSSNFWWQRYPHLFLTCLILLSLPYTHTRLQTYPPTGRPHCFPCTPGAHLYCIWRRPVGQPLLWNYWPGSRGGTWSLGMAGDTSRSNVSAHRDAGRLGANSTCEDFQGTGKMPALLNSVLALPAFPSGTHTMLFFLFFFFPLMQLRNTVYKTQWVVCTLVSNPLCFLSV